jgi:hypothetical protein
MQERTRRLAILVGGSLISCGALILAACSNDSGTTPIPTANGGTDGGRDAKTTDAKGGSTTDGTPETDSGSADCANAPKLRSNDDGFFCPFLPRDAGDASATNCTHDQTCCNPGRNADGKNPPSFCATTPRADKGVADQTQCAAQAVDFGSEWIAKEGKTWECGDKNNCSTGQVCCMFNQIDPPLSGTDKVNVGPNLNKTLPVACAAKQAFKYGGTYCAATCGDEDIQMCSATDNDCAPKKCVPFEVFPGGRNLAYCN